MICVIHEYLILWFFILENITRCLILLCWSKLSMSFIIKLRISRVSVLLNNLFVEWRWHRSLGVSLIMIICNSYWLRMVLLQLLTNKSARTSFFRSILRSSLLQIVLTLHPAILIKHILRWCFIHHEPVPAFIFISALLMVTILWIRLFLI